MINKVRSYIEQHNMLSRGDRIVVGVSGGADSICLYYVLLELSEEYELDLFVVHVNHRIREKEAAYDQAFVEKLCKKYNIPFVLVSKDVPYIAKSQGISEEEAGRNVRYEAFNQCYREYSCNKIAVAHNKNDKAETFLFNLFRGSGITGLSGIPPRRESIIRPLLCVERNEIEQYLNEYQIPYVVDSTNLTNDYSRNKIRNNILTYAQEEINTQTIEHISKSADMLNEIDIFIDKCVEKSYNEIVKEEDKDKEIYINIAEFSELDIVIKKELIRKAIKKLSRKLKDVDYYHVQMVLDLINKQVSKEIHLPYYIVVIKGYKDLIFKQVEKNKEEDNVNSFEPIDIPVPCDIFIPVINISLRTKIKKYKKDMNFPKETCTKWFDYDKINNTLKFRSRQEGDFIEIDNKGRTKKIKSLFIDEKIPREKRNHIPLIADGSHIIWILGGRISEAYKIDNNTKTILEIKTQKL